MQTAAQRLGQLPAYLFARIAQLKRQALDAGRDVIDFGVGDPDRPTPPFVVERLASAVRDPANHRYASAAGLPAFREAVQAYMRDRFHVAVDGTQLLPLLGSKEGLGHLPLAVINPGDTVLVPEPGYPVYAAGVALAGGAVCPLPLYERNGWLPALGDVSEGARSAARLLFVNYPNNPTGACAPLAFLEELVALAREYGIVLVHDAAYVDVYYDEPPPSILQIDGAADVAVEFHSLSKTFNMTGWRIGFAVGNADVLAALGKLKDNLDSGIFQAIQLAGAAALSGHGHPDIRHQREVYRHRRDLLVHGLRAAGWSVAMPRGGFYVWARCPEGLESMAVSARLLKDADVVAIPGSGFGACGEGYVRFALTVDEARTSQAVERISRLRW